ncbi:MAG: phenylalanine--tRNA ligase beta subunit-related protein [Anaerolineales bacterium]
MIGVDSTAEWRSAYPAACIGLLEISQVENRYPALALNERKLALAEALRQRYGHLSRAELIRLPVMEAYVRYYKGFDKTYHVLLQLESIVHKGKNFPQVSPLVNANFMAEVETFALTASHDADKLPDALWIDIAHRGATFCQMGGAMKQIPKGDMVMRGEKEICCSILYGQDDHSPITPQTKHVLYVTYAPEGVGEEAIQRYWQKVLEYVFLISSQAKIEGQRILRGG